MSVIKCSNYSSAGILPVTVVNSVNKSIRVRIVETSRTGQPEDVWPRLVQAEPQKNRYGLEQVRPTNVISTPLYWMWIGNCVVWSLACSTWKMHAKCDSSARSRKNENTVTSPERPPFTRLWRFRSSSQIVRVWDAKRNCGRPQVIKH